MIEYKVGDKYTGYSPDHHIDEYTVQLTKNGKLYLKAEHGRNLPIKAVGRLKKGWILK
jgi:hypothetical protein